MPTDPRSLNGCSLLPSRLSRGPRGLFVSRDPRGLSRDPSGPLGFYVDNKQIMVYTLDMDAPKTHMTRPGTEVSYCGIHRSVYVCSIHDPSCLRCQKNIEKEEIDHMFNDRGKRALMDAIDQMSTDFVPIATMEEMENFSIAVARQNPEYQLAQIADLVRSGLILIASGRVRLG